MDKKNKNWIWIIAGLAVLIFIIYFGIKWLNRDIVAVKTTKVSIGTIEAIVAASGIVDAPVYDLGTKLGGKISYLRVKEGDIAVKGQLLAEFDNYEQARNDFFRTRSLYNQGAASRQAYDAVRTIFESSRIVAPNNGIIAKINYQEGETVLPGQFAITMVNYENSWIQAQIDEIDIANVKIKDKVKITSDVYPDQVFEGEVFWIAPLAELRKVGGRVKIDEESYVFPCKIKFLNDHSLLKVNMTVNVEVITIKKENTIIFPREALVSKNDSAHVFRIKNNRALLASFEAGIRSYSSVEALSGLSDGDELAISNLAKLKNKSRVKIER